MPWSLIWSTETFSGLMNLWLNFLASILNLVSGQKLVSINNILNIQVWWRQHHFVCLCGGLVRVMLNGSTVHQDENMFKSAKGRRFSFQHEKNCSTSWSHRLMTSSSHEVDFSWCGGEMADFYFVKCCKSTLCFFWYSENRDSHQLITPAVLVPGARLLILENLQGDHGNG